MLYINSNYCVNKFLGVGCCCCCCCEVSMQIRCMLYQQSTNRLIFDILDWWLMITNVDCGNLITTWATNLHCTPILYSDIIIYPKLMYRPTVVDIWIEMMMKLQTSSLIRGTCCDVLLSRKCCSFFCSFFCAWKQLPVCKVLRFSTTSDEWPGHEILAF